MHDKKIINSHGFTIFELIIYLVIFGVVGTVAVQVLSSALQAKIISGQISEVQTASQRIMELMVSKVHTSKSIIGVSSTLHLEMGDASKNPTIFNFNCSQNISGVARACISMQEGTSSVVITPPTVTVRSISSALITNPSPSTSSVQLAFTLAYWANGAVPSSTIYTLQTVAMPL